MSVAVLAVLVWSAVSLGLFAIASLIGSIAWRRSVCVVYLLWFPLGVFLALTVTFFILTATGGTAVSVVFVLAPMFWALVAAAQGVLAALRYEPQGTTDAADPELLALVQRASATTQAPAPKVVIDGRCMRAHALGA